MAMEMNILEVFRDVHNGVEQSPRGQLTKEIRNYQWDVDYPFSSFVARSFSMSYLASEFMWYLTGDPFNSDIIRASKNWERFRQPEGNWFSNYGQYWFNAHTRDSASGFDWVVSQLRKDPDSRQAIIPMLQPKHLFEGNVDIVCTSYINFHIRNDKLHMVVRMRSSDVIWGYGNDIPCFWWLHEMVALELGIGIGTYTHSSDSLHVYEKHFKMLESICYKPDFFKINPPPITDNSDLLLGKYESDFGQWLKRWVKT